MHVLKSKPSQTALGLVLAVCFPQLVMAQGVDDLAAKFGARESVQSISISPDGSQLVLVAPRLKGGENAVVINLATSAMVPILSSEGGKEQISQCRFVTEKWVVCGVAKIASDGHGIRRLSRLMAISNDGKEIKSLSAKDASNAIVAPYFGGAILDYNVPGQPGTVLLSRWYPPQTQTGTIMSSSAYGLGVERVDVESGDRKRVELPKVNATSYISDGQGRVRIMETQPRSEDGYANQQINYSYRRAEGGDWNPLSKLVLSSGLSSGFEPVAVDSQTNTVYGFAENGNFTGLFKKTLDGSAATTLVLGRTDVDVDSLIRIGRDQRVVGASYATEKRTVEYFDTELGKLTASLGKALGEGKQLSIVDATAGETKLLIFAGDDTNPGKFYLFDKAAKTLGELLEVRPELSKVPMGAMKPVQFPAADGTKIPGYLTLPPGSSGKNLPAIVMPHGGPGARDEWGFDWLVQYFASQGYAVLQPNFRGSSGYGVAWFRNNGFKSWETAIGDVNDAGRWLASEGIAAPGKLAIFGWSYGGYAALQSAVVDPDLYKAIVAVAPVTDLDALREESRGVSNFYVVDEFIGSGPHVESGSPARHANRFKAPVLMFHGDRDMNVSVSASRLMKGRLEAAGKRVDYVEFPDLAHALDDAAARARLLSESNRFIRKALGL
jgi:dipeptidyl aminopeptidase/acylaminoacyl peptidase